jgi:hypothetical protein
MSSIIIPI